MLTVSDRSHILCYWLKGYLWPWKEEFYFDRIFCDTCIVKRMELKINIDIILYFQQWMSISNKFQSPLWKELDWLVTWASPSWYDLICQSGQFWTYKSSIFQWSSNFYTFHDFYKIFLIPYSSSKISDRQTNSPFDPLPPPKLKEFKFFLSDIHMYM